MPRTSNPGHLTKLFSSAAFSAFLSGLPAGRTSAHPDERHAAICRWLEELTNVAATLPDGNLAGRKIHERCAAVARAYREWYESNDETTRARRLQKLRKRVNALATAYRVRTKLLEEEVDLTVPRAMVEATARLLLVVPDLSRDLGSVVRRFASRISRAV